MNKTNIRHFFCKLSVRLMQVYVALALMFAVLIAIGILGIGIFLAAKALRLF